MNTIDWFVSGTSLAMSIVGILLAVWAMYTGNKTHIQVLDCLADVRSHAAVTTATTQDIQSHTNMMLSQSLQMGRASPVFQEAEGGSELTVIHAAELTAWISGYLWDVQVDFLVALLDADNSVPLATLQPVAVPLNLGYLMSNGLLIPDSRGTCSVPAAYHPMLRAVAQVRRSLRRTVDEEAKESATT